MIRAILISAISHGFFISMILLASVTDHESIGLADNRIQIRIGSNTNAKHALEPSTAEGRSLPLNSSTNPRESRRDAEEGSMSDELAALLEYEAPVAPRSSPTEQIQGIKTLDPLVNFDEQSKFEPPPHGSLLINWINGRERKIVSFPVIDAEKFPQKIEKLLDVVVRIKVSPQGEVLSAELVPPGSGNTRIDRYIHSAALQLTLEPLFESEGVQEAFLRLLFLEDNL